MLVARLLGDFCFRCTPHMVWVWINDLVAFSSVDVLPPPEVIMLKFAYRRIGGLLPVFYYRVDSHLIRDLSLYGFCQLAENQ